MVAKIKIGKSIRGILHYNENKIAEGEASLILASGFAADIDKMNFENKVKRFKHLIDLKPSVKTNALHISLNFEASEQIDDSKMQKIAIAYMEQIGFGDQPFLAYRHNDVAHQHVHIVTTSIQRNGEPINLHNIGREISEPARKQIEKDFNLVVAESKKYKPHSAIKPIDSSIITYGHIPTKRAINNVIGAVIDTYKFTSIAELNAVLKLFNVVADRGAEETQMFQKKGLQYSILDSSGKKVGVPMKASSFYSKPILPKLEEKFERNLEKRKAYKERISDKVSGVLNRYHSISEQTLIAELQRRGIDLVFLKNEQGLIYGTTFIDHISKTVFKGSALGKAYSAKAIAEVLSEEDLPKINLLGIDKTYLPEYTDKKSSLKPLVKINFLDNLHSKPEESFAPHLAKPKKKRRTIRR